MQTVGTVLLPGLLQPTGVQLECMFPASQRPYVNAGAVLEPMYYVKLFRKYMTEGERQRFIVSDTDTNEEVLIEGVTYGERDGTNDIYATLRLRGVRELSAPEMEHTEPEHNLPRASVQETAAEEAAPSVFVPQVFGDLPGGAGAVETAAAQPATQQTYVVQRGDTLSAICQRFYGDSSLAYRLAGANGIANANLIHPGDVLTLPDLGTLRSTAASGGGSVGGGGGQTSAMWTLTVSSVGSYAKDGRASVSCSDGTNTGTFYGPRTVQVKDKAYVTINWWGENGVLCDMASRSGAETVTGMQSMYFQMNRSESVTLRWVKRGV